MESKINNLASPEGSPEANVSSSISKEVEVRCSPLPPGWHAFNAGIHLLGAIDVFTYFGGFVLLLFQIPFYLYLGLGMIGAHFVYILFAAVSFYFLRKARYKYLKAVKENAQLGFEEIEEKTYSLPLPAGFGWTMLLATVIGALFLAFVFAWLESRATGSPSKALTVLMWMGVAQLFLNILFSALLILVKSSYTLTQAGRILAKRRKK